MQITTSCDSHYMLGLESEPLGFAQGKLRGTAEAAVSTSFFVP